jgi:ATP-binding cassette subfamily C protein
MRRNALQIMTELSKLMGLKMTVIKSLAVTGGGLGFACAIAINVFGAVAVAKLLGAEGLPGFTLIFAIIIAAGLLRGGLRYLEQYANHYIAFKLLAIFRDKIFGALRKLAPAKLENKRKGEIISTLTADIETLEVFYAHTLSPVCIALIVSLAVTILTAIICNLPIAICALLSFIAIGVIHPIISNKFLKQSGVIYRNNFADLNAFFLDSVKGIREIVQSNAGTSRASQIDIKTTVLSNCTKNLNKKTAALSAITQALIAASMIVVLVVGLIQFTNGTIGFGNLLIGFVLVISSFGPVIALSALPGNLTQTFASGNRVLNLLNEKPLVNDITNGKDFTFENLSIENLSFGYNDKNVIENFNLSVKKGEIVGLKGLSGRGKTTVLKLLLRFWEKRSGNICYNGIPIDKINTASLRKNTVLVSQNTYLFNESIAKNLKIAKPLATENELITACKAASIHEFIMSLPQGYDTVVGNLGDRLSTGEGQRIGLARAFLSGSPLILLDEPTSNVDAENEGIILKAIKEQTRKRAVIIVSHRSSTLAIADRIIDIS